MSKMLLPRNLFQLWIGNYFSKLFVFHIFCYICISRLVEPPIKVGNARLPRGFPVLFYFNEIWVKPVRHSNLQFKLNAVIFSFVNSKRECMISTIFNLLKV